MSEAHTVMQWLDLNPIYLRAAMVPHIRAMFILHSCIFSADCGTFGRLISKTNHLPHLYKLGIKKKHCTNVLAAVIFLYYLNKCNMHFIQKLFTCVFLYYLFLLCFRFFSLFNFLYFLCEIFCLQKSAHWLLSHNYR